MFNTPILLIAFNRPEHTRKVLESILNQNPNDLFIFQDGPRPGNEQDLLKCQKVRDVITSLTGGKLTHVSTFFSEKNLGCGPGPYAAISWFFFNVDKGIILEDDIIPHPLFFPFMEVLLNRYADDERIGVVMGHNFYRKYSLFYSYYFTFDTEGTLGWGTWKRVWENVDFNVEVKEKEFDSSLKKHFCFPKKYREREINHFIKVLNCDRFDRWDYQLEYCLKYNGYINIKPNSCLTSHEGTDSDATHSGYLSPNYKMEVIEKRFQPMRHPKFIRIDFFEWLRLIKRTFRSYLNKK